MESVEFKENLFNRRNIYVSKQMEEFAKNKENQDNLFSITCYNILADAFLIKILFYWVEP